MNNVNLDYRYLDHDELDIEGDTVYWVNVHITGPMLLRSADNQFLEQMTCNVFVQKGECRSDEPNDLLRCAVRRIQQLANEAHLKAGQETL